MNSLPIVVSTEGISFIVVTPAENRINLFNFTIETEIFQVMGVIVLLAVDDHHMLTVEENKFSILPLEHSVNVIELMKCTPHSVKLDRVSLEKFFVSESPHPDTFEHHQFISNDTNCVDARVTFVRLWWMRCRWFCPRNMSSLWSGSRCSCDSSRRFMRSYGAPSFSIFSPIKLLNAPFVVVKQLFRFSIESSFVWVPGIHYRVRCARVCQTKRVPKLV